MASRRAYISGVGGLVGSATAERLLAHGWRVAGTDADYRGDWFGPGGSVRWRIDELRSRGVQVTLGPAPSNVPFSADQANVKSSPSGS